jgi:hypothetical protein
MLRSNLARRGTLFFFIVVIDFFMFDCLSYLKYLFKYVIL